MSDNPDYTMYVKIDNTEFSRQVEKLERIFDKINTKIGTGMHGIPNGGVAGVISNANNGMAQMQMVNKQMGMFGKMSDGIGGILKNTLGIVGIAASVAAISALVVESSPILKSVFRLMNIGVLLLLRPIGDFIGMLLRPIMIMMLQKFILPYYQYVDPFMRKLGASVGGKIADFFNDPAKALYGLFVNILNWPKPPGEDDKGGSSSGGSSGTSGSSGSSAVAQNTQKMVQDTTKIANTTTAMSDQMVRAQQDTFDITANTMRMRAQFDVAKQNSEEAARLNALTSQKYDELYHNTSQTVDKSTQSSQIVIQSLDGINSNITQAKGLTDPIPVLMSSISLLLNKGKTSVDSVPDTMSSISQKMMSAGTNISPITSKATDIANTFDNANQKIVLLPNKADGINATFENAKTNLGNIPDKASSIDDTMQSANSKMQNVPSKVDGINSSLQQGKDKSQQAPTIIDGIIGWFSQANSKVQAWFDGLKLPAVSSMPATSIPGLLPPVFGSSGSPTTSSLSTGFTSYANSAIAAVSNALSSGHNVAGFGASGGIAAGATGQSYAATRMAEGGTITEHIFGVGESGKRYEFGESGQEAVVPLNSKVGSIKGGNTTVNIYVTATKDADWTKLKPMIMKWIQEQNSRSSRI